MKKYNIGIVFDNGRTVELKGIRAMNSDEASVHIWGIDGRNEFITYCGAPGHIRKIKYIKEVK